MDGCWRSRATISSSGSVMFTKGCPEVVNAAKERHGVLWLLQSLLTLILALASLQLSQNMSLANHESEFQFRWSKVKLVFFACVQWGKHKFEFAPKHFKSRLVIHYRKRMLSESEIFAPPLDTTFEINTLKDIQNIIFFRPVLIHKSPA